MEMTQLAFGRIPSFRKYELFMERYRSAAEIMRRAVPLNRESRLLDVGCGNGIMKFFFDDDEGQWHGIEGWNERADCCRRLGYDVVGLDLEGAVFPYQDESFDLVFASHVIEHLANPPGAILECARVLKPGGLLLVATPTKPPLLAELLNRWHHFKSRKRGQTQHAFSVISLRRTVDRALNHDAKTKWRLVDCRGLRLLSWRSRCTLEDQYWFYLLNTTLARHATFLTPEVNLIYRKENPADSDMAER